MKVALFHNFMDNIGGAEMVTLALSRGLSADIYTTNIDQGSIRAMGYGDVCDRIHSIGRIPKMAPFRHQLALWRFRRLDLGDTYDRYIISGDWAMSAAVNHHPNMWYVHSPLNELWQFVDYIKREVLSWWKQPIYDLWVKINRALTRSYSRYVDLWVANSANTQGRIERFYGHHSTIVHPPVDRDRCRGEQSEGYWLSVNRLITHKRIEIQMQAFSLLPQEKLIIVGSYERGARQFESYRSYIESIKPPNVEIRHWVAQDELERLYARCVGFVATAHDEDFGMTPVEAMAHGKPVVAANEGGYRESVISGETGLLIEHIDGASLAKAISEIGPDAESYRDACLRRAAEFDIVVFISRIRDLLRPVSS